ncbi:hypothetical protein JKY79_02690 [Candidatus Babeliales bacterium]|nr:hypothetical protein [Candidatus Babeliales bacterium]
MTGLAILESALFLPQAIAAFLEEEKTTFDKDELTYIKTNGKWRISAIFAEIQSVMWEDVSKIVLQKTVSVDHKKKRNYRRNVC